MQAAHKDPEVVGIAHWEETVSAWLDGESATDWPDELDSVAGRKVWDTYHLIGDVLRTTDLALDPSVGFRTRLAEALAQEPAIIARPSRTLLKVGLSGLAVAATVMALVWAVRPDTMGADGGATVLAEAGTAPAIVSGLNDYLDAHWQMAGPGAVRYVSFDSGAQR